MSFYKSMVKEYLLYGVVTLGSRALSIILLPIFTRKLAPAESGVIEILDITTFVLTAFLGIKLADAMLFFRSKARTPEEKSAAVTVSFSTALVCASVVWLACALSAQGISAAVFGTGGFKYAVQLALTSAALVPAAEMGLVYLRATAKPERFVAASLVRLVFNGGLAVYLLVARDAGIYGLLVATLATNFGFSVYSAWVMRKDLAAGWRNWKFATALEQWRYAAPLAASGIALLALHQGDRVFLKHFTSLTDVGVYGVAYKLGMSVSLVQAPLGMFWGVRVFDMADGEEGDQEFARAGRFLLLLLTSALVVIAVFGKLIVTLLTAPAYHGALALVPWIAMAYVLRSVADHFRSTLARHRRTDLDFKITITSVVVCLALCWALIPHYGTAGAAASTLASFAFMLAMAAREARRFRPYAIDGGTIWRLALLATPLIALSAWVSPTGVWAQAAVASLLTVAYFVGLALSGFFSVEEKKKIWGYCRGFLGQA